jgi:hypothetical protein
LILAEAPGVTGIACVNALLPKIRSIKGINMLSEKRLNKMDKLINKVYRPM